MKIFVELNIIWGVGHKVDRFYSLVQNYHYLQKNGYYTFVYEKIINKSNKNYIGKYNFIQQF